MRTLFLAVFLMPLALLGQSDTLQMGKYTKAIYSAFGSFTDLDNWNAGGENSSNVSFLVARELDPKRDPSFTTVHLLEGNYGISGRRNEFTKNADRLEFTTTLRVAKGDGMELSGQFNVRTQLAPGYAKGDTSGTPISILERLFMANSPLGGE
jgi:hypothetical protein